MISALQLEYTDGKCVLCTRQFQLSKFPNYFSGFNYKYSFHFSNFNLPSLVIFTVFLLGPGMHTKLTRQSKHTNEPKKKEKKKEKKRILTIFPLSLFFILFLSFFPFLFSSFVPLSRSNTLLHAAATKPVRSYKSTTMFGTTQLLLLRVCPNVARRRLATCNAYKISLGRLPAECRLARTYSTTNTTTNWESQKSTSESSQTKKDSEYKPNRASGSIRSDILRLLRLARPEYPRLGAAFLCLIATSTVSMSLPFFIGKIIDTTRDDEDEEKLKESADKPALIMGFAPTQFYSGLVVLFVVGSIANFGRQYLLRTAGEQLMARLRSRLFARILSQDMYFFDVGPSKTGMKTGDLISRLLSDTHVIAKSLSGNISDGARALISGCVGLLMMCWVSWKLTLCMSLIFPPLILMSTVYGRRVKKLSRTIQESLGAMTKVLEEKFNGLRTIQSFAQQRAVVHEYNTEVRGIFQQSKLEAKLSAFYYSTNGFLGNITLIGLLMVGSRLIAAGDITIGDLSSFMMYAVYTGSSVFGLGNFYSELMKSLGAAERLFDLIGLKPRIATSLGKKVPDLYGDVQLRDVTFAYPSRPDTVVFDRLNLTIRAGEHVCLVGPSGSGKSTVSQLLLRFYDPISGSVTVNNHNIRDLNLNFYRASIGYVQQDPLLFSGTIRENITFGKPESSDAEIEYATRMSNAYSFISAFPNGLDTVIGPTSSGSAQLSGGQRQRILLARTLIKRPQILILDEATSALDLRLEEIVTRNLAELAHSHDMMIISIAHRLLTIRNSERIIVFDGRGRIVEDGAFAELSADPASKLNKLLKSGEFAEVL